MQMSASLSVATLLIIFTPLSKSVLTLGGLLLCTALLITSMVAKSINSWFAFILFLIYISGLLVLFNYMMAMSPNTLLPQKSLTKLMLLSSTVAIAAFPKSPTLILNPMNGEKSFELSVTHLFKSNNIPMYWTIGIILLIALIMAVTVCYKSAKPLRSHI